MALIRTFYSTKNLLLAWKRLQTAQNTEYKNEFREAYDAYELGLDGNISNLSTALKLGAYMPSSPYRQMRPKPSGLLRPITLLTIQDQIVYQAMINVLIDKISERRKPLENKVAFSHIFNEATNLFMLKPWPNCYTAYTTRILNHKLAGSHVSTKFDLTGYYETISHDILLRDIHNAVNNEDFSDLIRRCLRAWTAQNYSHGIPQGPEASSVLAEIFLIPIDEAFSEISSKVRYVRYVDDINILSKNIVDAKKGIARLDELCRERGLLPHQDKLQFGDSSKRSNIIASLTYTDCTLPGNQILVEKQFFETLNARRSTIADVTAFKYILFRARTSAKIVKTILRLLPQYPDLADAFATYLQRNGRSIQASRRILNLLNEIRPFDYEEARYWETLNEIVTPKMRNEFLAKATARLSELPNTYKTTKVQIVAIMLRSRHLNSVKRAITAINEEENSIVQARMVSYLPEACSMMAEGSETLRACLASKSFDVSSAAARLVANWKIDAGLMLADCQIEPGARSTLEQIGAITATNPIRMTSVNTLLAHRLNTRLWGGWKKLLGKDYKKINDQLVRAERNYDNRSYWMALMDVFSNSVLEYTYLWINANHPSQLAPKVIDSKGTLIDYGSLLLSQKYLEVNVPKFYKALINIHHRRNSLPSSHPKDKRTKRFSRPLQFAEQKKYLLQLTEGYNEFFDWMSSLGLK